MIEMLRQIASMNDENIQRLKCLMEDLKKRGVSVEAIEPHLKKSIEGQAKLKKSIKKLEKKKDSTMIGPKEK